MKTIQIKIIKADENKCNIWFSDEDGNEKVKQGTITKKTDEDVIISYNE